MLSHLARHYITLIINKPQLVWGNGRVVEGSNLIPQSTHRPTLFTCSDNFLVWRTI